MTRIFLVPLLVVVLLTKFKGHLILGVPKEIVGAAKCGDRTGNVIPWIDSIRLHERKIGS